MTTETTTTTTVPSATTTTEAQVSTTTVKTTTGAGTTTTVTIPSTTKMTTTPAAGTTTTTVAEVTTTTTAAGTTTSVCEKKNLMDEPAALLDSQVTSNVPATEGTTPADAVSTEPSKTFKTKVPTTTTEPKPALTIDLTPNNEEAPYTSKIVVDTNAATVTIQVKKPTPAGQTPTNEFVTVFNDVPVPPNGVFVIDQPVDEVRVILNKPKKPEETTTYTLKIKGVHVCARFTGNERISLCPLSSQPTEYNY